MPLLEGQQALIAKLNDYELGQSSLHDKIDAIQARQQSNEHVDGQEPKVSPFALARFEEAASNDRRELEQLRSLNQAVSDDAEQLRQALEDAHRQNHQLEEDLAAERNKSNSAIGIEAAWQQFSKDHERSMHDLANTERDLAHEKKRNESLATSFELQAFELLEIRKSTAKLETSLVDRLSRIEEGVQHGASQPSEDSHSKLEMGKMAEQRDKLRADVETLRQKVRHMTGISDGS
jgi:predicted  nucleic acid-binding Zn-ribbon protein